MFEESYSWSVEKLSSSDIEMIVKLQDILIRHWLFSVLPGKVIANLSNQFSTRQYKKGQYIFHQDDAANRLFVILKGEVSIETVSLEGKVTKISHLNENEIFGEFALVDRKGRSASAKAIKSSTLASLPDNVFDDLLNRYPEFTKNLLKILVTRLRDTNKQVESIVTLSLIQRTAHLLLDIAGKTGPEIQTTQTELAERLFATREKVNSKLKQLERIGAIKTGHGKILVRNADLLLAQLQLTDVPLAL